MKCTPERIPKILYIELKQFKSWIEHKISVRPIRCSKSHEIIIILFGASLGVPIQLIFLFRFHLHVRGTRSAFITIFHQKFKAFPPEKHDY